MNCNNLRTHTNSQGVDLRKKINQTQGFVSDSSSSFGCSSSFHELQQPTVNMSIYTQQETIEDGLKKQIYNLEKLSGPIIHRFKSPASAFYATERCMGIPQIQFRSENSYYGSIDLDEEDDPNFDMRNTLQSLVKSRLSGNQRYRSIDEHFELSSRNFHGSKLMFGDKFKRFFDPNGRNDNIDSISFYSKTMNQPKKLQSEMTSSSSCFIGSSRQSRIRWTQELHEKFVECVKFLGGAEKATPKAILKLMDSQGLTVLHVKSHLQKYRNAKYMPESATERSKRRCISSFQPQFDAKTGMQIKEALQLQLDVQRRLHEQLEIQKQLQLQIEAQGRKLKMMFDEQQKTRQVFNNDDFSKAIDDGAQAYTSESCETFNSSSSFNPDNNFSPLNHC